MDGDRQLRLLQDLHQLIDDLLAPARARLMKAGPTSRHTVMMVTALPVAVSATIFARTGLLPRRVAHQAVVDHAIRLAFELAGPDSTEGEALRAAFIKLTDHIQTFVNSAIDHSAERDYVRAALRDFTRRSPYHADRYYGRTGAMAVMNPLVSDLFVDSFRAAMDRASALIG